jgi:hypothetical protein
MLIATNGPFSDTLLMPSYIHIPASPMPTITQVNDTLWVYPQGSGYQWYHYLSSSGIPGATNQFYVVQQSEEYTVSVHYYNCYREASFQATLLTIDEQHTNPECNLSGSIVITPSGGIAPYAFLWHDR